jgi:bifunctional ADP-heptose synthase (sugar kinase/adenylyltransferase)
MSKETWNLGYRMAEITTLEEFSRLRDTVPGEIWMTSGGYDPIHPGHITSIIDGATRCRNNDTNNRFVVVVNGDGFLREKKGQEFMELRTRCQIVSGIKGVDIVIGLDVAPGDKTVIKAIEGIRPNVFIKGGDRTGIENIPEWEVCKRLGTQIITNVGSDKRWSSSAYLRAWAEWYIKSSQGNFDIVKSDW